MASSCLVSCSSLSSSWTGIRDWPGGVASSFVRVPLPSPVSEPTDMGWSFQELSPVSQLGMLPPGAWENPMVPEIGEPGGRPSKVLSYLVTGEAQPSMPSSSDSLGSSVPILSTDMSNGGILTGVGEKLDGVHGPGNIVFTHM